MRPRVFPAEDATNTRNGNPTISASMRPRVFPAEDEAAKHKAIIDHVLQ